MKNKGVLWITTTALFIALLIAAQAAGSASLGQFIAGPLTNLILIVSAMTGGLASGLTAALVSPVFAKLLGIGPLWEIVPFIMAGNAVLVLVWRLIGKRTFANRHIVRAIALVTAAACKPAVLYLGILRIAVPFLLHLPARQAAAVSAMFSLPQVFTALAGGALAMAVLPLIEKVWKGRKEL
jgi:hypothetical protein